LEKALFAVVNLINDLHDFIVGLLEFPGFNLTDKDLHFWFIGIVGIIIYVFSDLLFRYVSKWSVSVISFIYTFTVLIVIVFGLEIEQKITGRGAMEPADIISGLWGFIAIFGVFLVIKAIFYLTGQLFKRSRSPKKHPKKYPKK
jgi:uncharacterized membrane protein